MYFATFLRFLPIRLSEYSRLFLSTRIAELRKSLRDRSESILTGDGTDPGLERTITEAVRRTLAGDFGSARSAAQVRDVIGRIRTACGMPDLVRRVPGMTHGRTVFHVPAGLGEFYENAPDISDPDAESRLYEDLVARIKRHPLPLALFLRAVLLSVVVWFLSSSIIGYLVPAVINVGDLIAKGAVLFITLIPIATAVWHYHFATLKWLRKSVSRYVGAVLRLAQTRAVQEVESEVLAIGERGASFCDRLLGHLDAVEGGLRCSDELVATYSETIFHRPVAGELSVPGRGAGIRILSETELHYPIRLDGSQLFFSDATAEQRNRLFGRLLDFRIGSSECRLAEVLTEMIIGGPAEEGLGQVAESTREYAEELLEGVSASGVEGWLARSSERQNVLNLMRILAFPPVAFHGAFQEQPPLQRWRCAGRGVLSGVLENDGAEFAEEDGSGLISVTSYRSFELLGDIAGVRALRTSKAAANAGDCPPSRVFVLAFSDTSNGLQLFDAVSDTPIGIGSKCIDAVSEFVEAAGIGAADDRSY
jgi:hypothetical protein